MTEDVFEESLYVVLSLRKTDQPLRLQPYPVAAFRSRQQAEMVETLYGGVYTKVRKTQVSSTANGSILYLALSIFPSFRGDFEEPLLRATAQSPEELERRISALPADEDLVRAQVVIGQLPEHLVQQLQILLAAHTAAVLTNKANSLAEPKSQENPSNPSC